VTPRYCRSMIFCENRYPLFGIMLGLGDIGLAAVGPKEQ